MATIRKEGLTEARVVEIFYRIAAQYGCVCTIDFEKNVVNFDGPDEARQKIAEALDRILGC